MKSIENYVRHASYNNLKEVIKANSPNSYGGTKLFDGDRDYLMQIPEEFASAICFFKDEFADSPINFLEIGTASNLTNTIFWNNFSINENIIIDNLECPNVEKCLVGNLSFKDGTIF